MVKVLIHGVNGFMGKILTQVVNEDENMQVVGGIDIVDNKDTDFPVFTDINECDVNADVLIDFSTAKAVDKLIDYCGAKKLPAVICTTGLSEEQLEKVIKLSETTPVLRSANMSLGVNTLMDILAKNANIFTDAGFDVEIVEKHHRRKLDAPSGTAIALADSVNEALDKKYEYVYDRSDRRQARPKEEIGISAVRGGTIVGEHDVIFAGLDEVITFSHTAYSRGVFATGAAQAAKFLANAAPGMYSMKDVINNK